jgi:hypothetical protein
MRKLTLLIALLLVLQPGCSSDDISSLIDDSLITTLNRTWKVISFEDHASNSVEYKSEENSWGKDIIVTFDDTSSPKIFSGSITTNSVHGEFEYFGQRQFKLNNYISTFAGQPVWADKFGTALATEKITFSINESTLRIYYENKSKSVTLTRQ